MAGQVFSSCSNKSAQLWRERKMEIVASADEIHARLENAMANAAGADSLPAADVLKRRGWIFSNRATIQCNGGFGGAPKFPQPSIPSLLLRYAKRFNDDDGGANGFAHLRPDGGGRHSRPARRRFRPLRRGCRMARAAFRKDALRQRAARAALSRRISRQRRRASRGGCPRHSWIMFCAT